MEYNIYKCEKCMPPIPCMIMCAFEIKDHNPEHQYCHIQGLYNAKFKPIYLYKK